MSRITTCFDTLKSQGRKALITYVTAGDPDIESSRKVLLSLPKSGANIVELGMPFSDPMADGPAIQAASQRAIAAGSSLKVVLELAREFRSENPDTPLVLMGYFNPIYHYGVEKFTQDASNAGVDGLLIVDLPPEEYADIEDFLKDKDLDLIRLVTPTTDENRLQVVLNGAGGFLYYVSITGVTGTKQASPDDIREHIQSIKKQTNLPVSIGFGVRTPDDVRTMAAIADGVVVGSAIVDNVAKLNDSITVEDIEQQVGALAAAL